MEVKIEQSWKDVLGQEFDKPYFASLVQFVKQEYATQTIYPKGKDIFAAFNLCPFMATKVVIIGQDPYHEPNQAQGMCFSVPQGVTIPPSLVNIYKELNADVGKSIPTSGDLTSWAKQGVLLLNATLTVRAHLAGSHQGKGWERFTDEVIRILNERKTHIVFLLWGSYAIKKAEFIDKEKHLVLTSVHPSPLSAHRGFFGNHHFSKTNEYLLNNHIKPIDW